MAHNGHTIIRTAFQDARNMPDITCILYLAWVVFSLSFCTHHALIGLPSSKNQMLFREAEAGLVGARETFFANQLRINWRHYNLR